jgi:DNA-binding LacI/PurR family transcriptional regulator
MKPIVNHAKQGRRSRDKSLYRSVADALRSQLSGGSWSAGQKVPSLRALAKEFSVSTMTVNQALRILHEDGLINYIPAVGAFVRHSSTGDTTRAQTCLAFATIDIESAFTARIAAGIEEACRNRGWVLQIYNAEAQPEIEAQTLVRMPNSGVKGAIMVVTADAANMEAIFRLKLNGFPFVLVDRSIRGLKVDVVESDHERSAFAGTEYLISRGFRDIRFFSCVPGLISSADARARGYERALLTHGIEPGPGWKVICDDRSPRGEDRSLKWYESAMHALDSVKAPVAFLALHAYAARGLLEACRKKKLRVPEDVSLVSFDDTEFMQAFDPPITVLAQRTREIGRVAVEQLERRIQAGPDAEPEHILIEMDLIERGSVRHLNEAVSGNRPAVQAVL